MEDFLDAKCTAACWNVGPRPALQQLQPSTSGANIGRANCASPELCNPVQSSPVQSPGFTVTRYIPVSKVLAAALIA